MSLARAFDHPGASALAQRTRSAAGSGRSPLRPGGDRLITGPHRTPSIARTSNPQPSVQPSRWAGQRSSKGFAPGGRCIYRGRMPVSFKPPAPRRTGAVQTPSPACIRCTPRPFLGFRSGRPRSTGSAGQAALASLDQAALEEEFPCRDWVSIRQSTRRLPSTCGRQRRSRPRHFGHG